MYSIEIFRVMRKHAYFVEESLNRVNKLTNQGIEEFSQAFENLSQMKFIHLDFERF